MCINEETIMSFAIGTVFMLVFYCIFFIIGNTVLKILNRIFRF